MTGRRRLLALASCVVAATLVAACGVPLDDDPQAITRTTIAPATPEMTTTPGPDSIEIQVFFLNDEAPPSLEVLIYPVRPEGDAQPRLRDALEYLLQGVPADVPEGTTLHTTVPPETRLRSADVVRGVAVIDLTSDIVDAIRGDRQKQAFAQIVFTAMAFDPEIEQVTFRIDGEPRDAPTDNNNLTYITTDDYDAPLNPR